MSIISKLREKYNNAKALEPNIYNFEYFQSCNCGNEEKVSFPAFARPMNISHDDALIVLSYFHDFIKKLSPVSSQFINMLNDALENLGFKHVYNEEVDEKPTKLFVVNECYNKPKFSNEVKDYLIWYTPGVRLGSVKSIYKKAGLPLPNFYEIRNNTVDL